MNTLFRHDKHTEKEFERLLKKIEILKKAEKTLRKEIEKLKKDKQGG